MIGAWGPASPSPLPSAAGVAAPVLSAHSHVGQSLGLTSRSACKLGRLVHSRPQSQSTPNLHVVKQLPPSAWKGPICHQKRRPLLFFFCILINTEEAGAVKFILGKLQNWFIWCCGTSYCFQYTISNQPFCILVFSFHFDKHCNYSY